MSTRHAPDGAPAHDNRYMSAPEFVEMRGISGTAIAAKAECLALKDKRSLLFFIQSLSIEQRGTKALARALVEMFPERIGTPSMLKFGTKPGQIHNARQVKLIRAEIEKDGFANGVPEDRVKDVLAKTDYEGEFPLKGEFIPRRPNAWRDDTEEVERANQESHAAAQKYPTAYPAAEFVEYCRERVEAALPDWLVELCINPRMELRGGSWGASVAEIEREDLLQCAPNLNEDDFFTARLRFFHDILGALVECKRRHEERARAAFAMTSIGKLVFEALDYGLKSQRMILIQGDSGVGKSESVKAWCDVHRGEARYVRLSGINGRRAFFGEVARACGVGATAGLSPEKIQARVENFLKTTGVMLVIDEGQYLWPQGARIRKHPELINWLDTACANEGIPVAIVATEEFTRQRRTVEHLTAWNSEQFRRRLRRIFPLPGKPDEKSSAKVITQAQEDLKLVAAKLLPGGTKPMIVFVAGYALASGGYMQAVVDAIDDARIIAGEAGRDRIAEGDLKRAIGEVRVPSDAAQKRVFAPAEKRDRRRQQPTPKSPSAEPPHHRGSAAADPLPPDGEDMNFADHESAPPQPGESTSPRATRPGLAVA